MAGSTLSDGVNSIYMKLKLYYYHRIFRKIHEREDDALTAIETFCAEAIYGLMRPTLSEFAEFINVSMPNAAYKIANLEKKGFIRKIRSQKDGRVIFLEVTKKFTDLYGSSARYSAILAKRIRRHFPEEEVAVFEKILHSVSNDLMKEVNRYVARQIERQESGEA